MPLPEVGTLQQGEQLEALRNPGFQTENLPSPKGFDTPNIAPIPIPGTGMTEDQLETKSKEGFSDDFINQVLGAKDKVSPGRLPQYTASEVFNPRYKSILPGEDSEEAFAKGQPWYKKWGNALTKMGATAIGTFYNTLTSLPDTVSAIKNGTPLDQIGDKDVDTWLKNLEDEFPNYYTHWEQDHPFMSALPFSGGAANFWGDKVIKNLGFTVGAIGGAVVQDAVIGAATEGIGAIPLIGAQIGRAALWLNKIFTGEDKVAELYALGKAAGRTGEQLTNLQSLARAAAATRVTNGVRFGLNLYGSSAAEAGFEARDGYNTVREDLIAAYQRENGYSPIGKELQDIDSYAQASSNTRFGINMVLLGVSNAIQFDTILKPFKTMKAGYAGSLQRELEQGLGKISLKEGSIDTFDRVLPKTIAGKAWSKMRPVAPSILTEGVYEEGGQYAAQIGTQNYYERKYLYDKGLDKKQYAPDQTTWNANDQLDNILHSTIQGMSAEFGTTEGLENVFLGALTGALIGGVGHFLDKNKNAQQRQAVLSMLNSQGVTGTFANNYLNAVSAHRIAEDMKEATKSGDIFKYKNFQHEQFTNFVLSGVQAGRFDVRMEQLNLLAEMPNDEFQKAFGLDKTVENTKTVTEYVDALKIKAQSIKKTYDLIDKTFQNPFAFNRKASSKEEALQNEKYQQFEMWKKDLTFLASINEDTASRLSSIETEVKSISPSTSNAQIAQLTNATYLKNYSKELKSQVEALEKGIKDNLTQTKNEDQKRIISLKKKIADIDGTIDNEKTTPEQQEKLFTDLLNYQLNGETDDLKVVVAKSGIGQLMEFGKDINRLFTYRDSANEAFDKLSTREGFEKYFADIQRAQDKYNEKPTAPPAGLTPTPAPTPPPPAPEKLVIKSGKNTKTVDEGSEQLVNLEGKDKSNPEPVKIIDVTEDGVIVEKKDGTQVTVPVENFFQEDTLDKEVEKEVTDTDRENGDNPPPPDNPPVQPETKEADFKKDLSFAFETTTDPTYRRRDTPFDNFQRRHQNFLFNLGSTSSSIFNQENRAKLRILPVTAKNAAAFGFPVEYFIGDNGSDPDNSTIRAVYVVDDSLDPKEKTKMLNRISEMVRKDEGIAPVIKTGFQKNPDGAIQELWEQYNSGTSTRSELILSIGDDIMDEILAYKSSGLFYVNEHGEKMTKVGETTNPDDIVFSTLSSTDLQFGAEGRREDRYTNKESIDTVAAQEWWRKKRAALLNLTGTNIEPWRFAVSRGLPNVINVGSRNSPVSNKLITEKDLDRPIITIATLGNVAILGAYNEEGEGIAAAKSGVKMPLGTPLLNYGGNLTYLNNRAFTQDEANNIFEAFKVIADRSSDQDKSALFKYLRKIIYMTTKDKATDSSITIERSSLYLGKSNQAIYLTPSSVEENKEKIMEFLTNPKTFHNIDKAELNRIEKNPKADDLQFRELKIEEGKVRVAHTWKNYNHYLLSTKYPEGGTRENAPLASNIAIPQADEVPIIQKYSIISSEDFDMSNVQRTPTPATTPVAPSTPVVEQKDKEQGVKKQEVPQAQKEEIKKDVIEWVKVGDFKLGFSNIVRDSSGKITDLTPVGSIGEDGSITPYKNPPVIKELLLNALRESELKQDETIKTPEEKKEDDSWLDDPDLKKDSDTQYRLYTPGLYQYDVADLETEFEEFRKMLPGVDIKRLDNMIKTTSGGLAFGALEKGMVYIYENAEVGTTYHEAFEAVWGHFLSGKEQRELYDEFTSRKGSFLTYAGQTKEFNQATVKEAKEQLAEEFKDYKLYKAGGSPQNAIERFFQRIIDFIKKFIYGDASKRTEIFKRINRGAYRNFSTSLRGIDEIEYSRVGLEQFNEALIQDALQGMTAELFSQLFKESSDIINQFEENPEIAATTIYDKLKDRFIHFFENKKAGDTLAAEIKDAVSRGGDRNLLLAQYNSIQESWSKIKDNWDTFVKEHQRYLRVFNVEFKVNDDGDIEFADEDVGLDENQSMTEYGRDTMQIDAKNSSSSKVKLLIATISDASWRKATEQAANIARNETIIKRENSLLALPKQAQYAKLFNYILHNVSNINGLYEIVDKMKEMTTDIAARKDIDANVQRVLNRIDFEQGFQGKTIDQAKILLSLENALSKQKPAFFRQFVDVNNETYFKTSVLNSKISQLKDQWIANIKGSDAVRVIADTEFMFSSSIAGINDSLQFLGKLGIDIAKRDYNKLRPKDKTKFDNAVNKIRGVVEKSIESRKPIPIISSRQLDFDSRLNELADIYVANIVGDDSQSQHPNLDNEPTSNFVLNNFVSTMLNDANNSSTREEFVNKIDNQYFNDIFHKDSILLNKIIFNEEGKFSKPVEIGVVEGRESWDQDNKSTVTLTEAERQVYEINNNLNGVFYTLLPADAKTEWAINVGTYLSADNFFGDDTARGNEISKFSNQMYSWLQTEVALAKDYSNRTDIEALNRKFGNRTVGNSLRFFADILPKDIVDKINSSVIDDSTPLGEVLSQTEMRGIIRDYVTQKAKNTLQNLLDWKLIEYKGDATFVLHGFDKSFLNNHVGKKSAFTETEVMRLLGFREMNYVMNNIEMHKFFFGDPAQYKDELKRIKSFLSGREVSHVDTLGTSDGFNQWANSNLNKVNNINLEVTDPGYHQFKNFANTATLYDIEFESSYIDEIKEVIGDRAKPYERGNEADASALMMATSYREAMVKAGGRFTAAQERQFQWEMAWERQQKAKEGSYEYTNSKLEKADKELLKSPEDTSVAFPVLKLIHSGIQYKNGTAITSLDKASWAPMFYRWYKGRGLGELYNQMQKKGLDYVRMESAHKVGIQAKSSTQLYNKEGNINREGIQGLELESVSFKHLGVQVEQTKKDKGQTEGSQARKIVTGDLRSNGVPIDFMNTITSQEAYDAWNLLSEDQKLKASSIYTKIKRHDDALRNLTNARTDAAMKKLGIYLGQDGLYQIEDKRKVSEFILSELERRELPRNIAYGLEVDPKTGDFTQPLEANAQYQKIRSILYSIMDKTIMRPKVSGGQKTMISVAGMEKSARIVKKTVNNKPVYTSNELKFYQRGTDGTQACEVMLPYWFGKKLKAMGSKRTKEEVIKYLNNTQEGKRLLKGIGFRIPTQGLNSIDFFVVKDFLPEQMGDVIVLPSEITVKAGSDFDIDKLNTYLRNYYIDNETGYPVEVKYKGSEEKTKEYIGKLLDEGNIISSKEKKELKSILDDELSDPATKFFQALPGVSDMFSPEQITRDFLGNLREELIERMYQQALENEYFDSIEQLVSLPENYGRLVLPNDASELKDLRTKIKKLKGETQESELGTYGKLLDSNFMMKERQAYVSSKGVVGIAAVAGTFNATVQAVQGGYVITDSSIEARFPHNTIDGKITLSSLKIAGFDSYISNIISQLIDGGVDVAKDKFLAEMGINADTLATFTTMVRMGASPTWAALFINQPAIQLFLKEKAISRSVSQVNPNISKSPDWLLIQQKIDPVFGFRGDKKELLKNKPKVYSLKEMEEMIGKTTFTEKERDIQLMMLDDYRKYNGLAWDLFRSYQGYNWDTDRLNDPNAVRLKELKYERANKIPLSPASKVIADTFIGAMKDNVEKLNDGLKSMINVQVGAAGDILDNIATDLFNQFGLNQEDRVKALLNAELAMVDFVVQTNSTINGKSLNTYISPLLLGDKATAKYIKAMQKSSDKRIANNPFVKNLVAKIDNRAGYPSFVHLAERDYDTYTSNIWTDSFNELKDDITVISINNNREDDRTIAQIYRNLVLTALLENGSRRTATSMSHLIPNETYSEFTRGSLINMNLVGFYENNVFYRTNWINSKLVPIAEKEREDPSDPLNLDYVHIYISRGKVGKELRDVMKLREDQKVPAILSVPSWKYADKKAIKTVAYKRDPNTNVILQRIVALYERVDVWNIDGKVPMEIVVNKQKRSIFKQINTWGDGNNLQEYHDGTVQSILPNNLKVNEVDNDTLTYAMYKAGIQTNISEQAMYGIITSIEGGNPEMDDEGNESPTPDSDGPKPASPLSPLAEATPKSSRTLKSMDAKQLYKQLDKLDPPTDAVSLAKYYIAGGGKISPEALYNEVIAVRDPRLTPTKKQVADEVRVRDYVERNAPTIKEAAHDIWDSLDEKLKDRISDQDIRNELINTVRNYNKRFDVAKEYVESLDVSNIPTEASIDQAIKNCNPK